MRTLRFRYSVLDIQYWILDIRYPTALQARWGVDRNPPLSWLTDSAGSADAAVLRNEPKRFTRSTDPAGS